MADPSAGQRAAPTRTATAVLFVSSVAFVLFVAFVILGAASAAAARDAETQEAEQAVPEAPPAAPPVTADDSAATVTASIIDGIRFSAPAAGGFELGLQLATWGRFDLIVPEGGGVQDFFSVPLVRPLLTASAFDGLLRMLVQTELAGPVPRFLDLQIDIVLDPAFAIRVGQFRTPYSRAFINPIVQLAMIGRGVVSDVFRADRDTGIMIFGRAGRAFEYELGIFDGARIGDLFGDTAAPMPMGRVVLSPYGSVAYDQSPSLTEDHPHGLALGVGAYYSDRDSRILLTDPNAIRRTASVGGDLTLVEGPFTFISEGHYRQRSTDGGPWLGSWGAFAQAGLFVVPRILEIDVRGGVIDPDTTADTGYVQSYEAGLKGYFEYGGTSYGHHLSLGLLYNYFDLPVAVGPLGPGSSHRVTAQLQIWI